MTFVSYAQNFEDVLLWRALGRVVNGFYIDVGAGHPDIDSVTRAFYDRGWSGINIEPTSEYSLRLAAARPRDINLQIALGERAGQSDLFVVDGTGLSTVEQASLASARSAGLDVRAVQIEVDTLAGICRSHSADTIHFLKIDVEGAERAVLLGSDFNSFRPWIVVVEATAPMSTVETHETWEYLLLDAAYHLVWFDGLNRFYVSAEKHDLLKGAFRAPPNVFDDFVRVADSNWAVRIQAAETRAALLDERLISAEGRAAYEAMAAAQARIRANELAQEASELRGSLNGEIARYAAAAVHAANLTARVLATEAHAESQRQRAEYEGQRAAILEQREREAVAAFETVLHSTSWRVTAPLRRLRARGKAAETPTVAYPSAAEAEPSLPAVAAEAIEPAPQATAKSKTPALSMAADPRGLIRTIHQFHPGSATGDAITNAMLLTRARLRAFGHRSDIFVCFCDPDLADELRSFEELPQHDDYVLIVHHSMGFDAFQQIASLPAPKILLYHNITPPEFLEGNGHLQRYSVLGREQLRGWRDVVTGALADSEYNALELRQLGYDGVQVCNTLLDVDAHLATARATRRHRRDPEVLRVLFVGRIVASKAQAELVDVFAAFRTRYAKPCHLVIVGRHGGKEDAYLASIMTRIRVYGIEDNVTVTGLVSDDALQAWYAAADIYLSLSHHEGFAVPLLEAMVHDLPVLARPAAAVPYTLGDTGGLLNDDSRDGVVSRLLAVAEDESQRSLIVTRQRAALERSRWTHHESALLQALSRAGAASPVTAERRASLSAALRFAVTGHISGSYSLASVNRGLALDLESARPGAVRVKPFEDGQLTQVISGMPGAEMARIARLVERRRPLSAPEVFISQNHPVHIIDEPNDLALAYVFWEESLFPLETVDTLNRHFKGILAPTRFVAKALIDSGIAIPVRVVGFAPRLGRFRELSRLRRPTAGKAFHFLHVSSGLPRKGVDLLLQAYGRAFRRSDPVTLTIKVYPNPMNTVAEQIARLQRDDPGFPELRLINEDIDEPALIALYREADAAVLPTRGEGYNLPAAEALAAGMNLIVTGFSGHLDFCNDSTRLIDYSFALSASHLASPGSVWAEPDMDDLVQALKDVASRRSLPVIPPSVLGSEAVTHGIVEAALNLLLSPPPRPPRIGWFSSWDVRCGIAEYSRHLVEGMFAAGPLHSLVVFSDRRELVRHEVMPGVQVERCWDLGMRDARPMLNSIGRADPDVLVIQHQPGFISWQGLTELLASPCLIERPVVVVLHSTLPLHDESEAERRMVIRALARVARIVVHTVGDLNTLKSLGLVENVTMMVHGAPQLQLDLPPAEERDRSEPAIIGCCGFFLPAKGIPELIGAIAALRSQGRRVRLRLVNADYRVADSASEITQCREIAERAGIDDAIEWHTDFLPDQESRRLLSGCDIIVLPYQMSKEGSSAALRMAMSAGVPVAVTPLPLFDEAGAAVFRFRGTGSADLANGIAFLLDRPERRQAILSEMHVWLAGRVWPVIAKRFHGMLKGVRVNWREPEVSPRAGHAVASRLVLPPTDAIV